MGGLRPRLHLRGPLGRASAVPPGLPRRLRRTLGLTEGGPGGFGESSFSPVALGISWED